MTYIVMGPWCYNTTFYISAEVLEDGQNLVRSKIEVRSMVMSVWSGGLTQAKPQSHQSMVLVLGQDIHIVWKVRSKKT